MEKIIFFGIFAISSCFLLNFYLLRVEVLSSTQKGELLVEKINKSLGHLFSNSGQNFELKFEIQYKFYSRILSLLFQQRFKFGSPVQTEILRLRSVLMEDIRFEKELGGHFKGSILQVLVLSMITWVFAGFTWKFIGFIADAKVIALIITMQLLGLGFFYFNYSRKRRVVFHNIPHFYQFIMIYTSLVKTNISVQGVVSSLPVKEIENCNDEALLHLKKILINFLNEYGLKGQLNLEGFDLCLEEMNFIQMQKFKKFISEILHLKLFVSLVFFFTGYLLYIFDLVGQSL